eukprot:tig00000025_g7945.t1
MRGNRLASVSSVVRRSSNNGPSDMKSVRSAANSASGGGGSGSLFSALGKEDSDSGFSQKQLEEAIFSVLFVMRRQGKASFRLSLLNYILDFLQLMAFPLDARFNWSRPPYVDNVLRGVLSVVPYNFLDTSPYQVYMIVFGIVIALVTISFANAMWVLQNFRKNKFPYIWPIKMLKIVIAVFFQSLYLSTVSILLRTLDCDYIGENPPYTLRQYDDVQCWGMPNAILSIVAIVATICVMFFAIALAVIDVEPNPGTDDIQATASSMVNVQSIFGRVLIVLSSVFLYRYPHLLALVHLTINGVIGWKIYAHLPHYDWRVNSVRAAAQIVVSWTCAAAFAMYFLPSLSLILSIVYVVGILPVAYVVFFFTRKRFLKLCNINLVGTDINGAPAYFGPLDRPEHVEIAARFVRDAYDAKTDETDQSVVERADAVYQQGLKLYPKSAPVYLAYSNYLKAFKDNQQLEFTYVDRSRHLPLDFSLRYAIFRKDREKEQSSRSDGGEGGMDLVSYVEFQKQLKAAKEGHFKCMRAMKLFWTVLQEDDETALARLSDIFRLVDTYETMADKNYTALLQKYPRSIRILRSFGAFVEQVKNDPMTAEEYFKMADAEEEEQSRRNTEMGEEGGGGGGAIDSRNGVVVIGANEIITSVNAVTCRLWGYKRQELVGKRITMLMPSPFKDDHNMYMTSYLRTGVAKVVNIPRNVFGLHKEGYIFPIKLYVTRMDVGSQVTFVGAITPLEADEGLMLVTASGRVTGCNKEAAAMFEMPCDELAQRDVKELVSARFWHLFDVEAHRVAAAQKRWGATTAAPSAAPTGRPASFSAGGIGGGGGGPGQHAVADGTPQEIQGQAKDGSSFPLSVTMSRMFDGEKTLMVVDVKQVEDSGALISIDSRGVIKSCNKHACVMFGYSPSELVNQRIEMLMPAPYSQYHKDYLERYLRTREPHVIGSKRRVDGKHKSGSTFGLVLDISEVHIQTPAGLYESMFVGRLEKVSEEEGGDGVITINQTGQIQNCNAVCSSIFGYRTSEMVGRNVRMLMPSHFAMHHDEYLRRYMETNQARVIGTGGRALEGLHRDGSVFPIQLEVVRDDTLKGQVRPGAGGRAGGRAAAPLTAAGPRRPARRAGRGALHGTITTLNDIDGIITITKVGQITSCNRHMCKLFGYGAPEELIGRNVKKIMPDRYADNHDQYLRNYLETGVAKVIGQKRELVGLHSDGSEFQLTLEVSETKVNGEPIFTARILRVAEDGASQRSKLSAAAAAVVAANKIASGDLAAHGAGPRRLSVGPPTDRSGASGASSSRRRSLDPFNLDAPQLSARSASSGGSSARHPAHGHPPKTHRPAKKGPAPPPIEAPPVRALPGLLTERAEGSDGETHEADQRSHADDAMSQSQTSSAGTRKRRRRKKILLLNSAQNRKSGVDRLWYNILWSTLVLSALVLGAFIAVEQIIRAYQGQIRSISASGERALGTQLIAREARGLHRALSLGADGFEAPSSAALRSLMEEPVLNATLFENTSPPRALAYASNFFDLAVKYVQHAQLVATAADHVTAATRGATTRVDANGTVVEVAASVAAAAASGSRAPDAAACLREPATCASFQFVLRNALGAALEGAMRATHLYSEQVLSSSRTIALVYIVTLCISLGVMAFLAYMVFGPTFRRVREERDTIMALFLHIPKATVKIMARRKIAIKIDSEEEDTEDEEAEDEREAEREKEHKALKEAAKDAKDKDKDAKEGPSRRVSFIGGKQTAEGGEKAGGAGRPRPSQEEPRNATALEAARIAALATMPWWKRAVMFLRHGRRVVPSDAVGARRENRTSRRIFRILALQYLAALLLIAAFFVVIFVVGMQIVSNFDVHTHEIEHTAERLTHAAELVHVARELTLDAVENPSPGMSTAQLRERLARVVEQLRDAHWELMAPHARGWRYPDVQALSFLETCLRDEPAACLGPDAVYHSPVSHGLDALVVYALDQAELLLADADANAPGGGAPGAGSDPRTASRPADLSANARFRFLWEVGRAELQETNLRALRLYQKLSEDYVLLVPPVHGGLMAATLAVLIILFFLLFRPMVTRLRDETRRTRRMLLMIPEEVADHVDAIRDYLEKSGG